MHAAPIVPLLSTILWGALLPISIAAAIMSPMMSDSATSGSALNWVLGLMAAAAALPLCCILSIAATWIIWRRTRQRQGTLKWQTVAALLPMLPLSFIVVYFAK